MTAKEKLLERAPRWSEEQAVRAIRAAEGAQGVDDWGELDAQSDALFSDSMRELAREERGAGLGPWVREPRS